MLLEIANTTNSRRALRRPTHATNWQKVKLGASCDIPIFRKTTCMYMCAKRLYLFSLYIYSAESAVLSTWRLVHTTRFYWAIKVILGSLDDRDAIVSDIKTVVIMKGCRHAKSEIIWAQSASRLGPNLNGNWYILVVWSQEPSHHTVVNHFDRF